MIASVNKLLLHVKAGWKVGMLIKIRHYTRCIQKGTCSHNGSDVSRIYTLTLSDGQIASGSCPLRKRLHT